jgi:uncharacterized protein YcfJ
METYMNKNILPLAALSALGFAMTGTYAEEMGRVISSTPIVQQVGVPRQVCNNEQVVVNGQKSGAGAAMGAIAGGAIGNSVGKGDGRAVATMLGLFGGAVLGDKVEGNPQPEVRNVQNCTRQVIYESRVTAYNVVYEYGGKQFSAQLPSDPGQFVRLQITPLASPPSYAPPAGSAPNYFPPAGSVPAPVMN